MKSIFVIMLTCCTLGIVAQEKKEKSKVNPYDLFWIKNKQYVCKGMFSYGRYICYGSTKLKEYFKFSEVTKIFRFGSLTWN